MSTHIENPIAEGSDYEYRATFVGPDEETPIEDDVITEILLTIRDMASATFIGAEDRDVTASLGSAGAFSMQLTAADNVAVEGSGEMQLRLMTFKITHSGGRKRNQEVTYYLDNMQDVGEF